MRTASWHRQIVLCALLVVATVGAYANLFRNGFVNLDDDTYITRNANIAAGVSWKTAKWAATSYYASNWHPLTWISHAVDVSAFGLNPTGHHGVGLLLHILDAILLFLVLRGATQREWTSVFVAALFALHPVNVESVAWASERKNVLSMMFLLLALMAYTAYARKPSARRYALVAVFFELGLMAKPQIVTLPFLLLLWDFWPLGRWSQRSTPGPSDAAPGEGKAWWALVLEKMPLFGLSGLSAWLTMKAQSAGGAVQVSDATGHAVAAFPISVRMENAVVAYGQYLVDAVWPAGLAAMYPHPGASIATRNVLVSAAGLAAIAAGAIALRRSHGYLLAGWLWFLGAMVPMIGLVQVGSQARADRYAYLPFIGLFIMVCYGIAATADKWPRTRIACVSFGGVVLLLLGAETFRQVGYWRNSETLWTRALQVTRGNFFAHDSLAGYLLKSGRVPEACRHFQESLRIFPNDAPAQAGLGVCYQARGETDKAIAVYEDVVALSLASDVRATAFANLGSIYRERHDYARARENFEAALRLNPDLPIALVGSGLLAQKGWDFSKAAQQYAHAMAVEPTSVGYLLLAKALEQSGRAAESHDAYLNAQRLSGDLREDQKVADDLMAN